MDSPGEILSLCRLCLVKDQVNIPIFEEQGDIRQIFLKISSCLPVTITRHDQLPKKICDGCSNKLDLLYEFWNSSASAEKTLLSWLGQAGVADAGEKISAVAQQIAKPAETLVKEESETLDESHLINESNVINEANLTNESRDSFEENSLDEDTKDEAEAPPPKRARRTAAVKAQINITPESDEDDDEDYDAGEAMTKMEDESDESESELKDDPSYSEVAGTSADDQAGPSGVGKDGVEAPLATRKRRLRRSKLRKDPDFESKIKLENPERDVENIEKTKSGKRKSTKGRKKGSKNQKVSKKVNKVKKERGKPPPIELDEPIECDLCNQTYKNNVAFAIHSLEHSEDKRYSCHLCEFKNTSKYHIEMHVRAHEGTTKYKCEVCDKAFTVSTNAIEHKYFHTGEKPFQCEICGKHFMYSRFLASHRRTQHWEIMTGTPLVKYDCKICSKHYTSSSGLKRHNLRNHNTEGIDTTVLCDTCGKRISSKEKLKFHIRIHTGYKPFACEVCGKAFTDKERLKEHMRVHTGEKPFVCKYCGKSFTQRSPLKIHERTHTGEQPYICRLCSKGFVSKSAMDAHMKSCSALQIPSSNAGSHYLASNRDLSYICTVGTCKKMFGSRGALEAHLTSHVIPSSNQSPVHSYIYQPDAADPEAKSDQQTQLPSHLQELLERRQFAASLNELMMARRDYANNITVKPGMITDHPQDFTQKRPYVADDDLVERGSYADEISQS